MNANNHKSATDWDDYSRSFLSVMPSQMLALNKEVASHMSGHVTDFGCGSGKIIPFVLEQPRVSSYTGVDAAPEMVQKARWMTGQFDRKPTQIIHGRIEQVNLKTADSALSINSYYNWPDSRLVLEKIYQTLKPDGVLLLATINARLDMPSLLEAAQKECIAHPHWAEFCEHNLRICSSGSIRLPELDELIGEARASGFAVEEAHQHLYDGGLSLLVLTRTSNGMKRQA